MYGFGFRSWVLGLGFRCMDPTTPGSATARVLHPFQLDFVTSPGSAFVTFRYFPSIIGFIRTVFLKP